MVALELLHHIRKKRRGGGLAVKIDLAKAYDSVNWLGYSSAFWLFGYLG